MQQVAKLAPHDADTHNNLAVTLRDLGRLDEAEASCRRALKIRPDFADAHCNLGNTLHDLGRLGEAEASYRQALRIRPDFADAHGNLGNTLHELGRLNEAEASYVRALQLRPDLIDTHCNLGRTLHDSGRLDAAEVSYRRALQIDPRCLDALNNLALVLIAQGKPRAALDVFKQSFAIQETDAAKNIFVACAGALHGEPLRDASDDGVMRAALVRALKEPWTRPGDLTRVGVDCVKRTPALQACLARAAQAAPSVTSEDMFDAGSLAALSRDTLLCALLESAPLCDREMERFLTLARQTLLHAAEAAADGQTGRSLEFYAALARQCFITEYVLAGEADEIARAQRLRASLIDALDAKAPVPILLLIAVAAYVPLGSVPGAARLLVRDWPKDISALLVQQIREPADERRLRDIIVRLTPIEDDVSLLVQRQYEDNPYPRWVKAAPVQKPETIAHYLRRLFPMTPVESFVTGENVDVLIAGCGTGQHSIETSQRFPDAKVLAIDLSMSSLCYAKRKTQEVGLRSITYAQADILKLATLDRRFDVIESAGVLHHLSDPWAGWRVLLSLLRPGGVMQLGFYSEIARRHVVAIRKLIDERGYEATDDGIRRCRQDLMALSPRVDFGNALTSSDFFSISACRDLLFHVQEHRMTLTVIDAFLRENNLTFLGFEIDAAVFRAYKVRFPEDPAASSLRHWEIFENENPDTFFGMYQFWIQKAV